MGVWQSNALPSHEDGAASLYADACRFNHSCAPSLEQGFNPLTRAQTLHVTHPSVQRGDQLSIAYINEPGTRDERRARLRKRFGFDCTCPLCSLEGEALEGSDACQKRMSILRTHIYGATDASTSEAPAVLTAVDELLSLQRNEGLPATWGQEYQILGMRLARLLGDDRAASRYAREAAEATRIAAGSEHPVCMQLISLANMLQAKAETGGRSA